LRDLSFYGNVIFSVTTLFKICPSGIEGNDCSQKFLVITRAVKLDIRGKGYFYFYSRTVLNNTVCICSTLNAPRPNSIHVCFALIHQTPRERAPGTHWIGCWMGPRVVLEAVVKRKVPSPRRESNPRPRSSSP